MWARDMPESFGPGPIGLKNLVATMAWLRRPFSAWPSMVSDSPALQAFAVSNTLTPESSASATSRAASAASVP